MRGVAIVGGVELIEHFHVVIYVLGATLLVLAWRIYRGAHEHADPAGTRSSGSCARIYPVSGIPGAQLRSCARTAAAR